MPQIHVIFLGVTLGTHNLKRFVPICFDGCGAATIIVTSNECNAQLTVAGVTVVLGLLLPSFGSLLCSLPVFTCTRSLL